MIIMLNQISPHKVDGVIKQFSVTMKKRHLRLFWKHTIVFAF